MSGELLPRTPELEWAHRSAAGQAQGLEWVDLDLDPDRLPFRLRRGPRGELLFNHLPYAAFLPPPIAEAAMEAQERGEATAWEGLLLVFARLEWLVHTRDLLWTPLSPVPRLLSVLVEAFGVDPQLHRGDPEVLARIAALLPLWHPGRGTVEKALEMLERAESPEATVELAYLRRDGAVPLAPSLEDELFACHDASWWARRREGDARPRYRIQGGFLRFQPSEGGAFVLRQEDVLVAWKPGQPLPRSLMRLLPTWTEFRLVVPENP